MRDMPLYNRLAGYYDPYWSDYARQVALPLRSFFGEQHVFARDPGVLDLGCGTGHLALHFLSTGCPVTGFDLSAGMLRRSRLNCRKFVLEGAAHFERRDIRRFDPPGRFGMVLSTYNTLNHLRARDLPSCFASSFGCLAEGGWLLFDLNTRFGFSRWHDAESRAIPGGTLRVERSFDVSRGIGRLRVEGRDGVEVFRGSILNHAHAVRDCLAALAETGFRGAYAARVDDLRRPLRDPESEPRIFLVAEKRTAVRKRRGASR